MPGPDPSDGDVTLASYDAAIARYLAVASPTSGPVAAFLDRVAELVGAGTVLELGSGPGFDAAHLEARGVRVQRSDATPAFVDHLRRQGHDVRLLDVRQLDDRDTYDAVLANAVLLHLSRAEFDDVLARARRAVRPGGLLAITLKEGDGEAWTDAKLGLPRHFTFWRDPAVRASLDAAGWDVLSLQHESGRVEPWLFVLARAGEPGHAPA